MLHHGSGEQIQSKECYLLSHVPFKHFFVVLHHQTCVSIIFISFSDKVSDFHNRLLINQKQELR